jgi:hypothetical protein
MRRSIITNTTIQRNTVENINTPRINRSRSCAQLHCNLGMETYGGDRGRPTRNSKFNERQNKEDPP